MAAPTSQLEETSEIAIAAVKVRTEVAYGKQYVSVIRQHSPADTLVVASVETKAWTHDTAHLFRPNPVALDAT